MALLFQLTQKLAYGFDAFWCRWPRKVAKVEATKAWKQVVTAEDEPLIHAALDWQLPLLERRDPEHIPHAATWLRGRRWDDEQPTTVKAPLTDEQRRVLARVQANLPTQPRQPMTEAQMEIRKRLAGEWGEK